MSVWCCKVKGGGREGLSRWLEATWMAVPAMAHENFWQCPTSKALCCSLKSWAPVHWFCLQAPCSCDILPLCNIASHSSFVAHASLFHGGKPGRHHTECCRQVHVLHMWISTLGCLICHSHFSFVVVACQHHHGMAMLRPTLGCRDNRPRGWMVLLSVRAS